MMMACERLVPIEGVVSYNVVGLQDGGDLVLSRVGMGGLNPNGQVAGGLKLTLGDSVDGESW